MGPAPSLPAHSRRGPAAAAAPAAPPMEHRHRPAGAGAARAACTVRRRSPLLRAVEGTTCPRRPPWRCAAQTQHDSGSRPSPSHRHGVSLRLTTAAAAPRHAATPRPGHSRPAVGGGGGATLPAPGAERRRARNKRCWAYPAGQCAAGFCDGDTRQAVRCSWQLRGRSRCPRIRFEPDELGLGDAPVLVGIDCIEELADFVLLPT